MGSSAVEHRVKSMEEGCGRGHLSWTKSTQHCVWEVRGGSWKFSGCRSLWRCTMDKNQKITYWHVATTTLKSGQIGWGKKRQTQTLMSMCHRHLWVEGSALQVKLYRSYSTNHIYRPGRLSTPPSPSLLDIQTFFTQFSLHINILVLSPLESCDGSLP